MGLRETIETLLHSDSPDEAFRQRQLLLGILDAFDQGGQEGVTALLTGRAASYGQESKRLLSALRQRLPGGED